MDAVINSLEDNLKELYRKAIDADHFIDQLKKQGKGKFGQIFKEDAGFDTTSNKFMPYLEETAANILAIKESEQSASQQKQQIELVVKQLHLLHTTLADFKTAIK